MKLMQTFSSSRPAGKGALRTIPMIPFSRSLFLFVLLCLPAAVALRADEGMWLFNNPPTKILQEKYHFQPAAEWL